MLETRDVWRGKLGARGQVKHAYHVAAEITGYVIRCDLATRRLTLGGTIVASDPYLLTQTPLVFVVATRAGARRWPIESIQVTADQLVARLGAMEGETNVDPRAPAGDRPA